MHIHELELESGLDRATIRYYEKEGLISPVRQENRYRDYSVDDLVLLKKIKLLRQLGISLDIIKQLKEGNLDFSITIRNQIGVLSHQMNKLVAAKQVCIQIQQDGVNLANLNPDHYQSLFEKLSSNQPPTMLQSMEKGSFREKVPVEPHPMRRFFGRMIDYLLLDVFVVAFVWIAIDNHWFSLMTATAILLFGIYGGILIMVPIESLMLYWFGTTIGKLLMGIRVDYYQGGRLYYSEALIRSWNVFARGLGYGKPVLFFARLYESYAEHHDEHQMSWDKESEVRYLKFGALNIVAIIALFIAIVAVFWFCVSNA